MTILVPARIISKRDSPVLKTDRHYSLIRYASAHKRLIRFRRQILCSSVVVASFHLKSILRSIFKPWIFLSVGVMVPQFSAMAGPEDDAKPEINEIRLSVIRHKKSVVEFGLFTLQFFPEYFPALSALPPTLKWTFVKAFLELHDDPKLWDTQTTLDSSHPSQKMPLESMRENWLREVPPEERDWIEALNKRESVYKSQELGKILNRLKIRLSSQLMYDLFNLEDLADVMDTKLYRWLEMGHKFPPPPFATETYFREKRRLEVIAQLARKVEITWFSGGLTCLRLF